MSDCKSTSEVHSVLVYSVLIVIVDHRKAKWCNASNVLWIVVCESHTATHRPLYLCPDIITVLQQHTKEKKWN